MKYTLHILISLVLSTQLSYSNTQGKIPIFESSYLPEVGDVLLLKNIYWNYDRGTLIEEAIPKIDLLASWMKVHKSVIVEIGVHSDSKGHNMYNSKLTQKRAESIARYLIQQGVEIRQIVVKGYGETKPIAPNMNPDGEDNPEGRMLNRRVELVILDIEERLLIFDESKFVPIILCSVSIRNMYFDYGPTKLKKDSYPALDTMIRIMKENPTLIVELGVHTDSLRSRILNQRWSEKKAISVKKYFIDAGIDDNLLIVKGYGESQPIAPNSFPEGTDNPEGRALNRRVEFKIIGEIENKGLTSRSLNSSRSKRLDRKISRLEASLETPEVGSYCKYGMIDCSICVSTDELTNLNHINKIDSGNDLNSNLVKVTFDKDVENAEINLDSIDLEEKRGLNISVFPNPTMSTIKLSGVNDLFSNSEIVIYDLQGQIISKHTINESKSGLDLSNLPAGTYFLLLYENKEALERIQFVKQ